MEGPERREAPGRGAAAAALLEGEMRESVGDLGAGIAAGLRALWEAEGRPGSRHDADGG